MNKYKHQKIFLFENDNQNYVYLSLFFIIFSIFTFFAIRPSLVTIFSLNKQASELEKINSLYEAQINNILQIQSELENNRDKLYLINQALPGFPQINKFVEDIERVTDENKMFLKNASIGEVNLFSTNNRSLKTIVITVDSESDFEVFKNFLSALLQQRRLKRVKKILITKPENESTTAAKLKISLEIESFYL